ncbi:MAG: hypothetical protein IJN25_09515 [Clostridia bacterium]|nr:hypothetical protein [Clostridia bacterium]
MNPIDIGTRREPFWDTFLADEEKTTACLRVNHPTFCDSLLELGEEFDETCNEKMSISYPILVRGEDTWRLYYHPCRTEEGWRARGGDFAQMMLCVLESRDGISWKRPVLDNFKERYGRATNIVFDELNDGIFIFYDENPACPPEEKYKGLVCRVERKEDGKLIKRWLHCYTSADGLTFSEGYPIHYGYPVNDGAKYDSLNIPLWLGDRYILYYRWYDETPERSIRMVRYAYSEDFHTWHEGGTLSFHDEKIYQLYTNQVMRYERAPHMFIGLPTRYIERTAYTPNMEQMAAYPVKKAASDENPPETLRSGLAVTDCLFMSSRDGENWNRFCEAFMTPGFENPDNWVYGDCYPSYGFMDIGDENYYFFTIDKHRTPDKPKPLHRWKIRKDGFAYFEADDDGAVFVTNPISFDGKKLHLNFETSAAGSIYVDLLDADGNEIEGKTSFEIFGNAIDREVYFADGSDFSEYAGKPVRLRFRMQDARLYSMKFE